MGRYTKKISKSKKKNDEECIAYIDDLLQDSETFYRPLRKKWNSFEYLYVKGGAKRNTPRGRANLELPIAFQQIEPFVDHLSELMFGETPYIKYSARNKATMESAEDITNFTQWQLEIGDFYPEWRGFARNLGKLGNAVMKIAWEEEIVEKEIEPQDLEFSMETGEPLEYTKDEVLFDGPKFYNLSLFEFRIPKGTTHCNVQKMPWVAHEVMRDPEDLLNNSNYKMAHSKIKKLIGINDGELESSKAIPGIKPDQDSSKEAGLALYGQSRTPIDKHQGEWKVVEWWGMYDLGKGKVPAVIVVAYPNGEEQSIILRKEANPFIYKFKPFIMAYDYRIEGEAYGYGELNHVKGLINETTALRNARLDRTNISLNSMWLVERQSGINLRELYTAPDKIILCDDKDGVEKLEFTGASQASVEELSRIEYDIQNTTEILNPRQDVSHVGAAFGRTATGISYLASRGQLRSTAKAKLLQYTFVRPLARILLWYNRQFMSDPEAEKLEYRVTGDESNPFRELDSTAFKADVDFIPESTPIRQTRSERADELSYMLQVVAQIEGVMPGTSNMREILKEAWKLKGHAHPEKFVNPEGPTIIVDAGNGQFLDDKGQPVQVVPIEQIVKNKEGAPTSEGAAI